MAIQDATLAMAVKGRSRGRRHIQHIATRHWLLLAAQSGVPRAADALVELVDGATAAIERVQPKVPNNFPENVWTRITEGILAQWTRFLAGLTAR